MNETLTLPHLPGIIMFEMWYPLPTFMEKYSILSDIRSKGIFPSDFHVKAGEGSEEIRKILTTLLDKNPANRPSAEELLRSFEDQKFLEYLS